MLKTFYLNFVIYRSSTLLKLKKLAVLIAYIFRREAEEFAFTDFVSFIDEVLADSDDQLRYSALKTVEVLFRYFKGSVLILEKFSFE